MVAKVPPAGITTYKGTPSAGDLGSGLHIKTADSGGSVGNDMDELVIEGSGSSGLTILSGNSNSGIIAFGDDGDFNIGYIAYDHSDNSMHFRTNDANQWSINSSGHLLPAATDHGIYLGVNSATAANLLDDYEEGTWTPANANVTLSVTSAIYRKVGSIVYVSAYVTYPSNSDGNSAIITGFPFTGGASNVFGYLTGRAANQSTQIVVQVNAGTTSGDVYNEADAGLVNSALSGSYFIFSGTYVTSA